MLAHSPPTGNQLVETFALLVDGCPLLKLLNPFDGIVFLCHHLLHHGNLAIPNLFAAEPTLLAVLAHLSIWLLK